MCSPSDDVPPEAKYFVTEDGLVARVLYDADTGECIYGEAMDEESAEWFRFPAAEILANGHEISPKKARKRVRRLIDSL